MSFQKATKQQAKLLLALLGPAGSGKTYSALKIGRALVGAEGRIALMDTEHGSASKYADLFNFDTVQPDEFSVDTYLSVIREANAEGYDLLILDSLSHAWAGKGGILEFVDNAAKRSNSGSSFGAWRDATPKHNALIEAMLACRCHLIVTMRVKMEHVQEKDERTGKTVVRKIGLQPVQRDGLEYEFDVVGDLTLESELLISKTRCPELKDKIFPLPGENLAAPLRAWLGSGASVVEAPAPAKLPVPDPVPAPTVPSKRSPSRKDLVARWHVLADKGSALGVEMEKLNQSWTDAELIEKAQHWKSQIIAASASSAAMHGAGGEVEAEQQAF